MQADYYNNICSILQLELHGYLLEENPEINVVRDGDTPVLQLCIWYL